MQKSRPKTDRRRKFVQRISIAIVIPASASVWFLWGHFKADSGKQYVTVRITRGTILRTVTATGTVDPVVTVQVGSYVSGPITQIYADYNAEVRAGELIAKIDPRPFEVKVDQAKAALANATAQLHKDIADKSYKQVSYQRDAGLIKKGAVSRDALDSARSALDQSTAQIELDQANILEKRADLRDAEVNLNYTNIVSPVNGTVIAREVDVGQTVAASFQTPTLFLIAKDLTKMQVDSNVSEADIGEVQVGQHASFTVDAYSRSFEGAVTQVRRNPSTVQNVVTYDVVVATDNPEMLLAPGMTAHVKIVTGRRTDVLRSPLQAIRYLTPADTGITDDEPGPEDPSRAFLMLLDQGRPRRVNVLLGLGSSKYVEVISDEIKAGDAIVVDEETAASGSGSDQPPPPPIFH